MSVAENLKQVALELDPGVVLVAVSKRHPTEAIQAAYDAGHRDFGENKVQEMTNKAEALPSDIRWHLIGHLQTNKVKYVAPFVYLIHSIDSLKLLKEVNKRAVQNDRVIDCLLQVHIAEEESKFGFDANEVLDLLQSSDFQLMEGVRVKGLMGMATFTEDQRQVAKEFRGLHDLFRSLQSEVNPNARWQPEVLSMGMSGDYTLAIANGSNMVRVGSRIFGTRNYV
jgi:pyridoxal phosphate enzyme (YggS family)